MSINLLARQSDITRYYKIIENESMKPVHWYLEAILAENSLLI